MVKVNQVQGSLSTD